MAAVPQEKSRPAREGRLRALVAGLGSALIVALSAWTFAPKLFVAHVPEPTDNARLAFEEATGVRVVRIAVSAGGGILDLRYLVLDPDKAVVVHDQTKPPTIIREPTGESASRPWMPHHGATKHRAGSTYYELIANPGGVVKRGDRVTLAIGDASLRHIVVE
ncbi:MAG: hypothetical protein ACREFM_09000 [Hypericibacter sp.]